MSEREKGLEEAAAYLRKRIEGWEARMGPSFDGNLSRIMINELTFLADAISSLKDKP